MIPGTDLLIFCAFFKIENVEINAVFSAIFDLF
jgi:hypothetical protein